MRIVLDCLKGEDLAAERCRRESIAQRLFDSSPQEFPETGK